ncbi:MAG: hypothetical protein WC890_06490 [Candidatus Margulisiibacteriota bacterium]
MKTLKLLVLLSAIFMLSLSPAYASGNAPGSQPAAENNKIPLGPDHYYIYQFNQKPILGTNILKVQIFNKKSNKSANFKVFGSTSMPSMGSAHNSGQQAFKLSKKNDYLLPIDMVMLGDWEISLVFYKGKTEYARTKIIVNL